jgi:hypothetical protein
VAPDLALGWARSGAGAGDWPDLSLETWLGIEGTLVSRYRQSCSSL